MAEQSEHPGKAALIIDVNHFQLLRDASPVLSDTVWCKKQKLFFGMASYLEQPSCRLAAARQGHLAFSSTCQAACDILKILQHLIRCISCDAMLLSTVQLLWQATSMTWQHMTCNALFQHFSAVGCKALAAMLLRTMGPAAAASIQQHLPCFSCH